MPRPSRRKDLVRAAAEEFAERGFDRATIEGIAERVGILKGSVYHYVDSKEELLFAVVDEPARALLAQLERLAHSDAPASERLLALFRAQVRIFADHYPAAFVYLDQIGKESQPEAFRARDAQFMSHLEKILDDGIRQGEYAPALDAKLAARAVIGILDWMQHWYRPGGPMDPGQLADGLFALAVGGLVGGAQVIEAIGPRPTEALSADDSETLEIVHPER